MNSNNNISAVVYEAIDQFTYCANDYYHVMEDLNKATEGEKFMQVKSFLI